MTSQPDAGLHRRARPPVFPSSSNRRRGGDLRTSSLRALVLTLSEERRAANLSHGPASASSAPLSGLRVTQCFRGRLGNLSVRPARYGDVTACWQP